MLPFKKAFTKNRLSVYNERDDRLKKEGKEHGSHVSGFRILDGHICGIILYWAYE